MRILNVLFMCFVLVVAAGATPLLVVFNDGGNITNGSQYVGPYDLTLNGNAITAVCVSLNQEVYPGETWQVNADTVADFSQPDQNKYLQAEWLRQQFPLFANDTAGIQQAGWDIFMNPGDPGYFTDSNTLHWLSLAQSNYNSVDPLSFSILVPITDSQIPQSAGQPQTFITNRVAETPESGTLVEAGTGIILAVLCWRKARKVTGNNQ